MKSHLPSTTNIFFVYLAVCLIFDLFIWKDFNGEVIYFAKISLKSLLVALMFYAVSKGATNRNNKDRVL